MDMLLSENQYIPKSGYRNRLLEDKKTIEYFAVLDNSGMLKSFCDSNKIDVSAVETTLNCYRNFEAIIDAHNEEYRESLVAIIEWAIDNHLILKTKGMYPVLHPTYEGLHYNETITANKLKKLLDYLQKN